MLSHKRVSASILALSSFLFFTLTAPGQNRTEVPPGNGPPVSQTSPLPPDHLELPSDAIAAPSAPPPIVWSLEPSPVEGSGSSRSSSDAGSFGSGMGREFRPSVLRADYRVTWFPDEEIKGQNTHLGFVREDFSASVPIWHDGHNDFAATVHVRNELFNTDAFLPNSLRPFPDQLWDVRFGGSYRHLFDNGWIAGVSVSLGSSGDKPFDNSPDLTGSIHAFLTVPQGERNYWLFNVSYSSNSDVRVPIPGVAFVWQPTDNFRMNIGLPFQLMVRPIDDLQFDVSYMLLYTFRGRVTYRLTPWLRIYSGYELGNEAYPLSDRTDANDRLFYYDQHVTTGLQYKINQQMSLDLSGGYTFDRFYFEGQHLSDSNNGNRLNVGDGTFLSLQFQARW